MIQYILQTPAPEGGQGDFSMIIFFGALLLIMYFFFFRPQMKKQKQEKKFQEELNKGQRVVTVSGMHGKINSISENSLVLETGAGKITFERNAISREYTVARFPEYQEEKSKK